MATQLQKIIQETLGDLENLSQEKVQDLIQEALKTFMALKEKINSTNPKEQDEAYQAALSLRETIQTQTEELAKLAGVDPTILTENQGLFPPEAWLELSSAKKELEAFRDQLGIKIPKNPATKKNKTTMRFPA